jgi:hypothetical protein
MYCEDGLDDENNILGPKQARLATPNPPTTKVGAEGDGVAEAGDPRIDAVPVQLWLDDGDGLVDPASDRRVSTNTIRSGGGDQRICGLRRRRRSRQLVDPRARGLPCRRSSMPVMGSLTRSATNRSPRVRPTRPASSSSPDSLPGRTSFVSTRALSRPDGARDHR